jgi:hypothetical protein
MTNLLNRISQNDRATISWSVERLLEGFDMSRRPLLFCRGAILLAACRAAPAFNSPCRRSQTLRRDAALVSRPKEQATRPRVLQWVKSKPQTANVLCPLFPRKRTCTDTTATSVLCQDRKSRFMVQVSEQRLSDPHNTILRRYSETHRRAVSHCIRGRLGRDRAG